VDLVELIASNAHALGVDRSVLEVQMLYGVREEGLRYLASQGHPVQKLISYGDAWFAWYMRRLAERPANLLFAVRELLPQPRRTPGR
jgi:proline dehydrogenase